MNGYFSKSYERIIFNVSVLADYGIKYIFSVLIRASRSTFLFIFNRIQSITHGLKVNGPMAVTRTNSRWVCTGFIVFKYDFYAIFLLRLSLWALEWRLQFLVQSYGFALPWFPCYFTYSNVSSCTKMGYSVQIRCFYLIALLSSLTCIRPNVLVAKDLKLRDHAPNSSTWSTYWFAVWSISATHAPLLFLWCICWFCVCWSWAWDIYAHTTIFF